MQKYEIKTEKVDSKKVYCKKCNSADNIIAVNSHIMDLDIIIICDFCLNIERVNKDDIK